MRTTLAYQFLPRFSAGLEYNPLADDVGLIANWVALSETEELPALILGTSSDRIGTPHDRAVYATLSKDLEHALGVPVAPYAGLSYSGFAEKAEFIGGVSVRWSDELSSVHIWDSHNLHHIVEYALPNDQSIGLVLADFDGDYEIGITYSIGFSMPWER